MVVVILIVVIIVVLQTVFFVKNVKRMCEFRDIFECSSSWSVNSNIITGFVTSIWGDGNDTYKSIENSINKYLNNNQGSVIEFSLLKDSVDRHCDSVEEDIATQTPIPLYCGLAGTMAGVIIGLYELLSTGAIMQLLGAGGGSLAEANGTAAGGINGLLGGVAWAMVASICGIIYTTLNSVLFKQYKLKEEEGKNSFLAWMQSTLLPKLPNDTSQALNNLVVNLNAFNTTFKQNTSGLGAALDKVNDSYAIQAEIIKAVQQMDVLKMAKANVKVLEQLEKSTGSLEYFNQYLQAVDGYLEGMRRLEEQFQSYEGRLNVLDDLRDFFKAYKGSMSKVTADVDNALKESMKNIKEGAASSMDEMTVMFVELSEEFKKFSSELVSEFKNQLEQVPNLSKQMDQIAQIPKQLSDLIAEMKKSNTQLSNQFNQTMANMADAMKNDWEATPQVSGNVIMNMPLWLKICIVVIAVSLLYLMGSSIFFKFFYF